MSEASQNPEGLEFKKGQRARLQGTVAGLRGLQVFTQEASLHPLYIPRGGFRGKGIRWEASGTL